MSRRVWRLAKTDHIATPLDGEGARRYGSRWTSPGQRVVYFSTEVGCAALEVLVHIGRISLAPPDYQLIAATIPDPLWRAADVVREADLPNGWRASASAACLAVGDAWLARPARSVLLLVPSAVVNGVVNVLFDPTHASAAQVRVETIAPFSFDPR